MQARLETLIAISACLLTFLLSPAADATTIVFDNGGPLGGSNAGDATAFVEADDFSVSSATNISGGAVYIESQLGLFDWDGTFEYFFWSSVPSFPGVLLDSGVGTNLVLTDTAIPDFDGTDVIKMLEFDLATPFTAAPGTTYYFGIHLGSTYDLNWIGWSSAALFQNQVASAGGTFDNWMSIGKGAAFYLEGTVVPEPSTALLLGLGLLGMASRTGTRTGDS